MPRREESGDHFLFLGRLSPEKGLDRLLRSWSPSFGSLLIAGDGPSRKELEAIAPDGVVFLGPVSTQAVSGLLAKARALVVPSRWFEGSPRTIVEAYAAGVPVVASDLGAMAEVVKHERSGLLVSGSDPVGWASAVERMLDDTEAVRLGEGAYTEWSSKYTPEIGLRQLEDAYREAQDRLTQPEAKPGLRGE